jgi:hypothetical protein
VKPGPRADAARADACWYRQPVAWLAALVLLASLGAVVFTITVAERYPDDSLPAGDQRVLKTPVEREGDPAAPSTPPEAPE